MHDSSNLTIHVTRCHIITYNQLFINKIHLYNFAKKSLWRYDNQYLRSRFTEDGGDSQFYEGKFMFKRT